MGNFAHSKLCSGKYFFAQEKKLDAYRHIGLRVRNKILSRYH